MTRQALTLAMTEYDHVADLMSGRVALEGIDLTPLVLPVEEIFFRMLTYREFDVSECSMAKYVALRSQGDSSLIALPIFPSRVHRHSSIYVRRDGPVHAPADLVGRRVGLPEWAQTAAVYSRGALVHQYGLDLTQIEWLQAGVNQPGRKEKVALKLPEGIRLTPMPENSLNAMLLSGEVDAVLSAHAPDCIEHGHPDVRRLFENYMDVEQDYMRTTGIFPIMHTVVVRRERLERAPWIARELMKGFEEAKRRSMVRALDITAPRFPIPWCYGHAARAQAAFGEDWWPYGIEANRPTLEAFLQYAFEQGVCERLLTPDELFAPETVKSVRV